MGLDQQTTTIADVTKKWQQLVLLYKSDIRPSHEGEPQNPQLKKYGDAYALLMTFYLRPWVRSADGKRWTPEPPKEKGPLRQAEDFDVRINATGLPISTKTGECVCDYCDFQRRKGCQSPHLDSADEQEGVHATRKIIDDIRRTDNPCLLDILYGELPACDLHKPNTPEKLAYLGNALDKHVDLAACLFERVMREAVLKDGFQGQAEKWYSFRDGFPLITPVNSPKPALPRQRSDIPTSNLAATANFCMLTIHGLQKTDDCSRGTCGEDGSIDLFVQKMLVHVKRWRSLIDVMMPLAQPGAIDPTKIGKTNLAIDRLVNLTIALCPSEKK